MITVRILDKLNETCDALFSVSKMITRVYIYVLFIPFQTERESKFDLHAHDLQKILEPFSFLLSAVGLLTAKRTEP